MMLAVENWETGSLEVAMLLDEAPNRHYSAGAGGQAPWRTDGPLATAARTADLHGYAWLILVFRKDDVRTWGSKRVKVMSGGRLFVPIRDKTNNVQTGFLRELKYASVSPDIYGTKKDVPKCRLQYRVIRDSEISFDPDQEEEAGEPDSLLGYAEKQRVGPDGRMLPPSNAGKPLADGLGCRIDWVNEKSYSEEWLLMDAAGINSHRFELTEYQRRPFVRDILRRLGMLQPISGGRAERIKGQVQGDLTRICESLKGIALVLGDADIKPPDLRPRQQEEIELAMAQNGASVEVNGGAGSNSPEMLPAGGDEAGVQVAGASAAAANAGWNMSDGTPPTEMQAAAGSAPVPKAVAAGAPAGTVMAGSAAADPKEMDIELVEIQDSEPESLEVSQGDSADMETQTPSFLRQFEPASAS